MDEFWKSVNSLFKRRFRQSRRLCCVNSFENKKNDSVKSNTVPWLYSNRTKPVSWTTSPKRPLKAASTRPLGLYREQIAPFWARSLSSVPQRLDSTSCSLSWRGSTEKLPCLLTSALYNFRASCKILQNKGWVWQTRLHEWTSRRMRRVLSKMLSGRGQRSPDKHVCVRMPLCKETKCGRLLWRTFYGR